MKGIRNITPYVPGEQPNFPKMIKINTNENPYPPSPKVQEVLENFDTKTLKLYSSIDNREIKQALSSLHGLTPEHFVIGNGSDEILAFCFLAFFNSSEPILFPDITYGFYKVWADLFHIPYQEIPLTNDYKIDSSDYKIANGGIVIANPNAPTGLFKPQSELIEILESNLDVIVLVDEAYIDFAGESAQSLLSRYENLIVVRTLSKSQSLAGLRIGYALGHPKYIQIIESIKSSFNPYSVDSLAEKLATASILDAQYFKKNAQKICQTRDWFKTAIEKLGFQSLDSKTNFLLTTHAEVSVGKLYYFLNENNIFVRYFPENPRLKKYLRISIGTQEEMEVTVGKIEAFMNQNHT